MDVNIRNSKNEDFKFSDAGIIATDFIVSSIEIKPLYGEIEGRNGSVDYGASYGQRTITVPIHILAKDNLDYPLLRDEVFAAVKSRSSFYIQELRFASSGENTAINGKRYKVRLQSTFAFDQIVNYGEGELVFETTELPFAESTQKSMWINSNGVPSTWKGMGFEGIENPTYRYRGYGGGVDESGFLLPFFPYENSDAVGHFRIYNAGNVEVHPYEQDLTITIYNAVDSTEYFELKNETNGTKIRLKEGLRNRRLVFDGANITLGGMQAYRKTDRTFISLEPGWNEFVVKGAQTVTIDFDFPFYYK